MKIHTAKRRVVQVEVLVILIGCAVVTTQTSSIESMPDLFPFRELDTLASSFSVSSVPAI